MLESEKSRLLSHVRYIKMMTEDQLKLYLESMLNPAIIIKFSDEECREILEERYGYEPEEEGVKDELVK